MSETHDREKIIGEHVGLYGITTADVLRRRFFPDMTDKAVARMADRLVESKFLAKRPLPGGGRYFKLGERGAGEFGPRFRPGRNSGYQALVARFGVLYYCAKVGVDVYSPSVFRERYPELSKPGFTTSNYYRDAGDVNRLGSIHVDHGRGAERLATRMRSRIGARYRDVDFASLIVSGRFLIAIVTATEEKARAVREELQGRSASPVTFRVEAVPELKGLLLESPRRGRGGDDV